MGKFQGQTDESTLTKIQSKAAAFSYWSLVAIALSAFHYICYV
ncbi:hypothetical protein [Aliterella atlantica]|nr:hypothetical protein [Aliterella atlantica]